MRYKNATRSTKYVRGIPVPPMGTIEIDFFLNDPGMVIVKEEKEPRKPRTTRKTKPSAEEPSTDDGGIE